MIKCHQELEFLKANGFRNGILSNSSVRTFSKTIATYSILSILAWVPSDFGSIFIHCTTFAPCIKTNFDNNFNSIWSEQTVQYLVLTIIFTVVGMSVGPLQFSIAISTFSLGRYQSKNSQCQKKDDCRCLHLDVFKRCKDNSKKVLLIYIPFCQFVVN